MQCHCVRKVVSINRSKSFHRVRQSVKTRIASQATRLCACQNWIHDCHRRRNCVVSNRVLVASLMICNNCKRSNFRSCSRRRWYTNQASLFTKRRNLKCALSNIEELFAQISEGNFWMLVKKPHNFCSIHRRSAANSNNRIWLELFAHHFRAALNSFNAWLWLNVVNNPKRYAIVSSAKLINYLVYNAKLLHNFIAHNNCALNAIHVSQIANSIRLKIRFGRNLEPLHIVIPSRYALYINKIYCLNVSRNRVSTIRTTAQSERRCDCVVDVTNTTQRSWGVPNDSASVHAAAIFASKLLIISVNHSSVTSSVNKHLLAHFKALFLIFSAKQSMNRSQLFHC